MLATGLTLVIGLAVLVAGRRLFWLFVGAVGFAVGLRLGAELPSGQPEWIAILVALGAGVAGALLAVFFQWVAIALAGFAAGGHVVLVAAQLLGARTDGWVWLVAAAGGLLAAALLLWLWDAILVTLSALVGAALLVSLTHFGPTGAALAFALLFIAGVLIQASVVAAPAGREPGVSAAQRRSHRR